ncbi:MAG: hypothetical protein JNL21_02800 [Myxococcales bacterium]|nr:hypothetical protein [Myxococcales bacterium]
MPELRPPVVALAALVLFAGATSTTDARADAAVADQLFKQAKELMKEGKISEACERFRESYETDPALGALLNLADCLERDGRVASAYGRWGEAAELAGRKQDERVTFARERRDALKGKLSFLTVQVSGSSDGLSVYRGNTKLTPGAFGIALPTDPGEAVVQVVRGDAVLWERKVVLKESESATVLVDLGEIARVNPPPVKKRVDQKEGRGDQAGAEESFWNPQRIAGLAVMGAGVAGAAVGFTFGGLAMGKSGDIDDGCTAGDTRYCTQAGTDAVEEAKTFADASTYTLIASGIVAAVGLTVFVTAPSSAAELDDRASAPALRIGLTPILGPDAAGLVVQGTF